MPRPLVWITAGEASGDAVGAMLAREIKRECPECRVEAVGGRRLARAADGLLFDSSKWGAIGVIRSLPKVPGVWGAYRALQRRARESPPDLVIPVDFGAFNIPLIRKLRPMGVRVLYYMPPGSWRRDRQGNHLPALADLVATPFEWSARLINDAGGRAEWVGHPLLDTFEAGSADGREPLVVVMPGSRDHEVRSNLPHIAQACAQLSQETPSLSFAAAVAPHTPAEWIAQSWHARCGTPLDVRTGQNAELLAAARAAIVCSGTATLEAVIARCPLVVVYHGDALMNLEYRIRRPKFDFIALPSILLGRKVCEELIQDAATPERIASETRHLLWAGPARDAQLADFEEVRTRLGTPGASARTARLALSLLSEPVPVR
jgi:lipid-A-disaccharide synthase